jgi:spore germination cell wall hydrolase CwlJ-like protein
MALRNIFAGFVSLTLTATAALYTATSDPKNEVSVGPDDIVALAEAPVVELSYAELLNQNVFKGPNRAAKVDRPRYPSALQIASAFEKQRVALLDAKKQTLAKELDTIKVAAITPKKPLKVEEPQTAPTLDVQEMPQVAALDAIKELDEGTGAAPQRDPALPFPAEIPTKLAYARDNAPKTEVFKQTLTQASMEANKKQHWCMATAIYFEARGESYRGQVAVAQVVRNRVKHSAYPNTICGVVFQNQSWKNRCQFSFACDGIPERVNERGPWKQAEEIATKVINGDIYLPEVANATHYHADYVWPKWAPRLKKLSKIGVHIFYRFKNS